MYMFTVFILFGCTKFEHSDILMIETNQLSILKGSSMDIKLKLNVSSNLDIDDAICRSLNNYYASVEKLKIKGKEPGSATIVCEIGDVISNTITLEVYEQLKPYIKPNPIPYEPEPVTQEPNENNEKEFFSDCDELRRYYSDGVSSSHPAYRGKLDRDHDGWACESYSWQKGY